jgi:photosystem II stability/assembly factor-like uncharacterized protein
MVNTMNLFRTSAFVLMLVIIAGIPQLAAADEKPEAKSESFSSLEWRNIGPARGGRAQTVTGSYEDRGVFYMGATGGGVWKTTNAGASWANISDDAFGTGSVGAIAVAPSDPNVIYVGMGETCIRGNFSHGDGVYRSFDAGKTWTHMGLTDSRQIGRVIVHPTDPAVVYVAALGHIFGENSQRGVFRSTDSGESWSRVLAVNDGVGAVDIAMDPNNSRVLFAAMWQVKRTPWSLDSGGAGSGLYRSTDGGDTWEALTEGLPKGVKGKIGVSVSKAQRDLVYAIVEAEDGGVFRSTDGGDTWTRTSEDRSLRQRAWYYTHITADPDEPDTVYVLNVRFHKSIDGGRTWSTIRTPHGDNHALWIDPTDNKRMINGNDGGANVSFDGGDTWSTQTNQPTAQFYHVTVDNQFPYRIYGAQQDNSTASVSSLSRVGRDWRRDLYPVGGGESGYIAVHPDDANIIYAGSYGGYLTRYDHATGLSRNIAVWPENPMGSGADDLVHRFQWTFPIVLSPHNPDTVYVGGEALFRSRDGGDSWDTISGDLTTNDKTKQRSSGGPITQDNTSVEYYCTIFTIAESPLREGMIWVGTDDGLVQMTSDGGESWSNVTPSDMGDWPLISMVEASTQDADTAYLAVNRYKMDDFHPYIYRTRDGGDTWDLIVDGIDDGAFVRSVREDPERAGLLYAATETGVYVSLDAGDEWEPLQLNLPRTPVTDLVVKGNDLVVSTQGRSFWVLRDLAVLRQYDSRESDDELILYSPASAHRKRWDSVRVHFSLPEEVDDDASLVFLNEDGSEIRSYTINVENDEDDAKEEAEHVGEDRDKDSDTIAANPGMNQYSWDMRMSDPVRVPGAVAWPPHPSGPRVEPGRYAVELRVGDTVERQEFNILPDPRVDTTQREYEEQFALLVKINDTLSDAHRAVNDIRSIRKQINQSMKQAKAADLAEELNPASTKLLDKLKAIEEVIIQTKSKSPQDPLNYPIKINDRVGALVYSIDGDFPPTEQSKKVYRRLSRLLQAQLDLLDEVNRDDLPEFNRIVEKLRIPAVVTPSKKAGAKQVL